jgi:hypothetical protein
MAFVGSLSGSGGASNTINVTGSMIIANPGTGGLFPAFPGTDTVFFVSGAIDGKAAGSRTVSVFGGDTVVSGSITIGTGSIRIDSNEIRFQGGAAKITSGSGGLTFFDSGNSGGVTLASLAAGAGGGDVDGPASATDNAIARFDQTTGKIIQNSLVTISDLDVPNAEVTVVGDASATTISLFNTAATTVNFAGGATAATNIGNASGLTTIAGDLKVAGNNIKSSTGATAITLSGGNVIIPGDLTVQGTTLTVDATTIEMEDPVIGLGFTSGSTAVSVGDRGFIGGLDGVNNAAFIWDQSEGGFAAIRTTSGTATGSPITVTDYSTLRAGKFELGGGTAVFLSSSDGASVNLAVATSATASFSQGGTTRIQFGDIGGTGEGEIKGMSGTSLGSLWLSGTSVNIGVGGGGNQAVKMYSGGTEVGRFTGAANTSLTLTAQSPGVGGVGTARTLILTGSSLTLGANNQGIAYAFAGSARGSLNFGASTLTMGTESGVLLSLSGSNGVRSVHGTNGHAFRKESADGDHLTILSDGPGDSLFSALQDIILKPAGNEVLYRNSSNTTFLTVRNSSNNADIFGGTSANVTLGSGTGATTLTLSGSTVVANAGLGGFVFQKDGAPELHVNALGTTTRISGSDAQSVTLAAGTGATLLTLSGSAIDLNASAGTGVNFKKDGELFAIAGQTPDGITGLFPNADSGASLGSPQRRWANVYTGDLHLRNDRGNWTIIEEEEYLSITNNISGRRYKFVLEEI